MARGGANLSMACVVKSALIDGSDAGGSAAVQSWPKSLAGKSRRTRGGCSCQPWRAKSIAVSLMVSPFDEEMVDSNTLGAEARPRYCPEVHCPQGQCRWEGEPAAELRHVSQTRRPGRCQGWPRYPQLGTLCRQFRPRLFVCRSGA